MVIVRSVIGLRVKTIQRYVSKLSGRLEQDSLFLNWLLYKHPYHYNLFYEEYCKEMKPKVE